VEFVTDLPKSPVGKVLRRELRDMERKKLALAKANATSAG